MEKYGLAILLGIVAGFGTMVNATKRLPPLSYLSSWPINSPGLRFIAAGLGAVSIPAIAKPDYVAVTFLVLAAQQFRDVRNMERKA